MKGFVVSRHGKYVKEDWYRSGREALAAYDEACLKEKNGRTIILWSNRGSEYSHRKTKTHAYDMIGNTIIYISKKDHQRTGWGAKYRNVADLKKKRTAKKKDGDWHPFGL